jgi:hypothetical protein
MSPRNMNAEQDRQTQSSTGVANYPQIVHRPVCQWSHERRGGERRLNGVQESAD